MAEEDNHYVESLRNFIQSEFRSEVRDKSAVVLDCLVCKHNPSPDCPVCFPNKHFSSKNNGTNDNNSSGNYRNKATKRFSGYASATHFHNVGRAGGNVPISKQYVDLRGEAISEETINANKQARQLRQMQNVVVGLRETVQRLELEKSEITDALKQVTFVCSNMRNRQKHLDMQLQRSNEEMSQRDQRLAELEDQLRVRDEEIHDLKIRCANSEACRSNATKELRVLRQQLTKQTEHMSLFSLPTYRSSGNQLSTLANNQDLHSRQPQPASFFFNSSGPFGTATTTATTGGGGGSYDNTMDDFQANVEGEYFTDDEEEGEGVGMNAGQGQRQGQRQGQVPSVVVSDGDGGGGGGGGPNRFASWRSMRTGSGISSNSSSSSGVDRGHVNEQQQYSSGDDVRDCDTVSSGSTSATVRTTGTTGTTGTNTTTPMHSLRSRSHLNTQYQNQQAQTQTQRQQQQQQQLLADVASKIDPATSGIGTHVLTRLVSGVPPNEVIKQNNIRKYAMKGSSGSGNCSPGDATVPLSINNAGVATGVGNAQRLDVTELSDGGTAVDLDSELLSSFQPDTRMTAQLVRGTPSPQELIRANNMTRYQAPI